MKKKKKKKEKEKKFPLVLISKFLVGKKIYV